MQQFMLVKSMYSFIGRFWRFIPVILIVVSIPVYILEAAMMNPAYSMTGLEKTIKDEKKKPFTGALVFEDGRLTVRITSALLKHVMDELGRQTGVKISWLHPDMGRRISAGFTGLPLHEAVQDILYGESYVLSYTSSEGGEKLSEILIIGDSENAEDTEFTAHMSQDDMFNADIRQLTEKKDDHDMDSAAYATKKRMEIDSFFMQNRDMVMEELVQAISDDTEIDGLPPELRHELSIAMETKHNGTDPIFLPPEVVESLVKNMNKGTDTMKSSPVPAHK